SQCPWLLPDQQHCLSVCVLCVTPEPRGRSTHCGDPSGFPPSNPYTGTRRSLDLGRSRLVRRRSSPFHAATTVSQASLRASPAPAPTANPGGGACSSRTELAASGAVLRVLPVAIYGWL